MSDVYWALLLLAVVSVALIFLDLLADSATLAKLQLEDLKRDREQDLEQIATLERIIAEWQHDYDDVAAAARDMQEDLHKAQLRIIELSRKENVLEQMVSGK